MYTLKALVSITKPFAIALQEPFLANDTELLELKEMLDYKFYFNNRPRVRYANLGGGVAIIVLNAIPQSRITFSSSEDNNCVITNWLIISSAH